MFSRSTGFRLLALVCFLLMPILQAQKPEKLIVLNPGHFHASLLQKEMYPELDRRVAVYSPLGPELLDYLKRVSLFNDRPSNPTTWQMDVHTSDDPLQSMLRDQPGGVLVLSGRNRGKIDAILAGVEHGMHVLADKPWIIASSDLPKLERALDAAERKNLAAYDIMTERYEVTSEVQRALVNSPGVFGTLVDGDRDHPAVVARSVHHIMKVVAGVPLQRPTWFFDTADYGEGLSDVGTHPVDLIQWTILPEQAIDVKRDIEMISGRHEALSISRSQFQAVTRASAFPAALAEHVHGDSFDYFCNNFIEYKLRGHHVKLDVLWAWEAPAGAGDVYEAAFHGSLSTVEIRQGAAEKGQPEVYVVPTTSDANTGAALDAELGRLQAKWPGIRGEKTDRGMHIAIPTKFRVGHEEHFAQVAKKFFEYMHRPSSLPRWERSYMLAKYYVTTRGVEMGRGR